MEGFAKQGLRRHAHSRGDVCDCGADAAGNVDGAALRIVGGHGDAVACGSRSLSREQRLGRLPQLARGSTGYRNIYSDIPLIGGRVTR